ncbi:hypothetical protein PS900_06194 [Pseudomonas fluorescens]|uniref:Uncharacterized protein n=1 Tax=Pseudomonas fluorescens TaxID=294 RepID=A0A8H2NYI2_PSEFL|nr:hypothetical protein PS900_06194 [Pseudomonas fluorescens]
MLGDVGVVAVVARVGAQLRRPAVEVADLQVQADHETADAHQHRHQNGAGGPLGGGEAIERIPQFAEAFVLLGAVVDLQCTLGGFRADTDVGQRHRHQQQRGEDQYRDTDAGGDRQVLDHRDVDQHQHGKAHGIGQQRGDAGNEQTAEGVARSDQLMGATGDVLHDAVHLLRGVGHTDGEDQKRHQHRVRIDGVAEPGDNAQLPDHRDQRAADHQQGAAHATGVGVDDDQRRDDGQAEEHHHLDQAVDQVAHELGEADHPHLVMAGAFDPGLTRSAVAGVFDLVAQLLFEHLRKRVVVDALATGGGFVHQRHDQHGRLEVAGHQAAHQTGAGDVLAQLFNVGRRALITVGHHRATLETVLGDFGPAHRRAPQRLHPRAVDAFGEEQLVVDLLEYVEVFGVENIALGVLDHHPHRVAQPAQRVAVFQEVLDVRLALRNHFFEAGAQLQASHRHEAQHHGGERHQQHEQRAVVEHQPFEEVAGALVEIPQLADHRHGVLFDIAHVWVLALRVRGLDRRTASGRHGCPLPPTRQRRTRWHRRPGSVPVAAPDASARPSPG